MKMLSQRFVTVILVCALPAFAQGRRDTPPEPPPASPSVPPSPPATPPPTAPFPAPPAVEKTSITKHALRLNGKDVHYTATAGTMVLKREDEKPRASIFYIAYTVDDVSGKSKRPVTYTFNGGPGSSSVWLHMGAFGPKRVVLSDEGTQVPPPYRVADNEFSALAFTDLVFIDPVDTGFSRAAPGENPQQFHGLEGDLDSIGDFIRQYTTRNQRWSSPKFVAGESYGTTRAAALSENLLRRHGLTLNGIVLISSILNFMTARFEVGNDLPYILFLPTYTATAWYHHKLAPGLQGDLQEALRESERFAANEYTVALMKGDRLAGPERADIAQKLARLTGLKQSFIEQADLRVSITRFTKELLRDDRRTVGRYDSRLQGIDMDAAGERSEYDPSYASVQGAYTGAFNDYVRDELKYQTDLPYEILTARVQPWSYAGFENRYVNVAERLRQAITQNPGMRVMVANGYYDLATPYFATQYTFNHIGLDAKLSGNVSLTYCEAGHMLYTKKSCLKKLHDSMSAFYTTAASVATAP